MEIAVRDAQPSDADAIAAVHAASSLAAYRGLMSDEFLDGISVQEWSERWAKRLQAPDRPLVWVAVSGDVILGLCWVLTPSRDQDTGGIFAEFVAVYVSPPAWRSGVGGALVNHALGRLRRAGWRAASLWILEGNDRACSFYERLGFKLDGSRAVHEASGASEVRMRLPLDAVA